MRSFLFVPATRPDRISKALTSGADAVIVDLEDAVALQDKAKARLNLQQFLQANPQVKIYLRVNATQDKAQHVQDLILCDYPQVQGVFLPKAEQLEAINQLYAQIKKPIFLIIETALGVQQVSVLAQASGVQQLSFGALDLALDLGFRSGTLAAEHICKQVRCALLIASRAAGLVGPIDAVYPHTQDSQGMLAQAKYAVDMGFSGVLCIHPAQVPAIHQAFVPSADEVQWAQEVLALFAQHKQGVFMHHGEMIDAPVIAKAKGIVAQTI